MTAHYFYKSYRESAEAYFVIRQHSVSYVVLSLLTIVSVFALVYFYPDLIGLFYSVYFINYYYFFIVIVGLALSRFHVASRLFRVYGKRSLEKALEVAKKQARIPELKKYKIGKSPEIDQMLDRVAENKSNVKPTVREIEVKILDKRIADLEKNLGDLLSKKNPTQPERHKIKLLERQVVFSRKSMDEIREKREK